MITATSLSCSLRFSTVSEGGGTMLPSVFISANCWSNRSVTASVPIVPSSLTPTKTRPGFSRRGKSLAKAQMASPDSGSGVASQRLLELDAIRFAGCDDLQQFFFCKIWHCDCPTYVDLVSACAFKLPLLLPSLKHYYPYYR